MGTAGKSNRWPLVVIGVGMLVLLATSSNTGASAASPSDLRPEAAVSDRDPTFGNDGLVLHRLPVDYNGGRPIPVEAADGKIFVIDQTPGLGEIVVYRFLADGRLDPTFVNNGQAVIDYPTDYEVAGDGVIDAQGRLVMVAQGYYYFPQGYRWLVIRMNPDGTLDDTFGSGGFVDVTPTDDLVTNYDYVNYIGLDSQDRIVVGGISAVGTFNQVVLRLTEAGSLDPSFGNGGRVFIPIDYLVYAGKISLDSTDGVMGAVLRIQSGITLEIVLFRLTDSGAVDGSFGNSGTTRIKLIDSEYERVTGLVVDDKGRMVLFSYHPYTIFLARFLANGKLDTTYGDNGVFRLSNEDIARSSSIWADDLVAYPGGRVMVLGTYFHPDVFPTMGSEHLVLRVAEKGTLDPTFSGDGIAITDGVPGDATGDDWAAGALMVDSVGRIVAGGITRVDDVNHLSLIRYLAESDGPLEIPGKDPDPDDPPGSGSTFTDTAGSVFEGDIEWLAERGITRGCNPPVNDRFCPNDPVTRGQMAAFLNRALGLTAAPDRFTDTADSVFSTDIGALAAAGITRGCNPPANTRFCPDDPVTRGQMAAFLVRALGYTDNGGGDLFVDDDHSVFESDIDRLGTAGVTRGCNPPTNDRFCPDDPVTRGQMAAFLHRALAN